MREVERKLDRMLEELRTLNTPTAIGYSARRGSRPKKDTPFLVVYGAIIFEDSLPQVGDWLIDNLSTETMEIVTVGSFVVALIIPPVIILLFAKHRLHAALSVVLMYIFFNLIMQEMEQTDNIELYATLLAASGSAIYLAWILPLILLSVAPAKAISRRLIFLAIGLLLLIALNELSKLGLDVTAPKLQD